MSVICRLAEQKDYKNLALMRWLFIDEENPSEIAVAKEEFQDSFAQWCCDSDDWSHFIADQEGVCLSTISLCFIKPVPRPIKRNRPIGYLTNTYTLPEWRNQGIGSQLLKFVLDWAEKNDFETVVVWPSDRSIPFYKRGEFSENSDVLERVF